MQGTSHKVPPYTKVSGCFGNTGIPVTPVGSAHTPHSNHGGLHSEGCSYRTGSGSLEDRHCAVISHSVCLVDSVPQLYPSTPGDGQIPSSLLLRFCCELLGSAAAGLNGVFGIRPFLF